MTNHNQGAQEVELSVVLRTYGFFTFGVHSVGSEWSRAHKDWATSEKCGALQEPVGPKRPLNCFFVWGRKKAEIPLIWSGLINSPAFGIKCPRYQYFILGRRKWNLTLETFCPLEAKCCNKWKVSWVPPCQKQTYILKKCQISWKFKII